MTVFLHSVFFPMPTNLHWRDLRILLLVGMAAEYIFGRDYLPEIILCAFVNRSRFGWFSQRDRFEKADVSE
jgi:hypothetical protein